MPTSGRCGANARGEMGRERHQKERKGGTQNQERERKREGGRKEQMNTERKRDTYA